MGHGKVVNPPFTVDAQGVPVGFTGGRYGQDVGLQLTIAQQHTAVTCPADTNENTLFSYAVPGGMMGPNDSLRVSVVVSTTNSANNKTLRLKFGGTQVRAIVYTTSAQATSSVRISNRNTLTQQVIQIQGDGTSTSTANTASQDTSTPTPIILTGQLALGTESLVLESVLVELIRGA